METLLTGITINVNICKGRPAIRNMKFTGFTAVGTDHLGNDI